MEFTKATPGYENSEAGYAQYVANIKKVQSPLVITEIMSANKTTLIDDYGEYSDWVEIYNSGDSDIDLEGYYLSDDLNDMLKWKFPAVTIKSKQYLIIYCSGKGRALDITSGYLHTNFSLSSYKEAVSLSTKNGQLVMSVEFENLPKDNSYAYDLSNQQWALSVKPTPGQPNTDDGFSSFLEEDEALGNGPIVINEIMPYNSKYVKTGSGQYYDWIELKNISSHSVSLKDWGLTDNTGNPSKWRFSDITMAAGEKLIVLCSGLNKKDTSSGYLQTNYRLSVTGEVIALFNAEDELIDRINVSEVPSEFSYGRVTGSRAFFYFQTPTPGSDNGTGAKGFAAKPVIELAAGQYRGEQQVTLSCAEGAEIRYTTDGSVPTKTSKKYTSPITITETTALRARAFSEDTLGSAVATASYFIDSPHTLPIVSLVTDPDNLFDKYYGIYTVGTGTDDPAHLSPGANFWNDWERPVHFEYIEEDGDCGLSVDAGIKIFGAYSRVKAQKGLSIFARSRYGADTLAYPFFDSRPYTEYKSIVLRAGANDYNRTKIRDIVMTDLVRESTTIEVAAYKQCVVYINGEYWGIYNIREKINKYMLAQHNDIKNPDNIDLLVGNSRVLVGSNADYLALINFVKNNDLSVDANYKQVCDKVDIENFIDWNIAQMYSNNADLGNIKFFRSDEMDGKWRWVLYDFCWGLLEEWEDGVARLTDPAGMGAGHGVSTALIRSLLKNDEFEQLFLERFAYHLNNTFNKERVLAKINECADAIDNEIDRDFERWDCGSRTTWRNNQLKILTKFAEKRVNYLLRDIQNYFNLSNDKMMDIFGAVYTN